MGVSPLSCPLHQIQRLPFILEEECVVGCKPAVMSVFTKYRDYHSY